MKLQLLAAVVAVLCAACGGEAPSGTESRAAPARQALPQAPSSSAFLDWAQEAFPGLFPGTPPDESLEPYAYRYYAASGNYLGTGAGGVYVMGPVSGGQLLRVAELSAFSCLLAPSLCGSQLVSVPNAVGQALYPLGYAQTSSTYVAAQQDPCDTAPASIDFPSSFLGKYRLPFVSGGPLPVTVQRGVTMKDAWDTANPTFASGCSGSMHDAFLRSVQRVRDLGGDTLSLTPWTLVNTSGDTWSIPKPQELGTSTISDDDLAWATAQAKAAGLKVTWVNQIQGTTQLVVPAATTENIGKFLDALDPYLVERAQLAQQLGIDAMQISCICWFQPSAQDQTSLVESRMAQIAAHVKAVYSGKLVYENLRSDSDAALVAAVDYQLLTVFQPWIVLSDAERAQLSLALLRPKLLSAVQAIASAASAAKPIIWHVHFGSRSNALEPGYLEETFCTAGFNVITGSADSCIQRDMPADFSLQAILHEAALEAIAQQDPGRIQGVEIEYWMTDGVTPSSTFPNLATSIRNKPAEAIVQAWFRR